MVLLDYLRDHLRDLPGVEEDLKWETNHCFTVGGKIFAMVHIDPAQPERLTLPTDPDERAELLENPYVTPAPYLGRAGWVTMESVAYPRPTLLRLCREAHLRVARRLTKAKQRALGLSALLQGDPT